VRFSPDPQAAVANLLAGEVHFVSDFITGLDAITAVAVLTAGKRRPTHPLTHPQAPYYAEIDRGIQTYPYDPRRAQQMLEEAGYATGPDTFCNGPDGRSLQCSVASSSGTKNELEAATYVDCLRRAGFAANQRILPAAQIRDLETRALLSRIQIRGGGNRHVVYTSEQIPRTENRWRGDNRGGWSNAAYDRAVEACSTTLAEPEQVRHLAQMEQMLTEQVPVSPLLFSVETNAQLGALRGPVARQTPNRSGTFLHVPRWEWRVTLPGFELVHQPNSLNERALQRFHSREIPTAPKRFRRRKTATAATTARCT
jgi:ABC-type transport system substrate-binding protein